MPKACRSSYNMAFKLKVVAEAEVVENNSEIAREYGLSGCLPFVRIVVRVFAKSPNQPNKMAFTICNSISRNCFLLMRDWKLESFANSKEISAVPV